MLKIIIILQHVEISMLLVFNFQLPVIPANLNAKMELNASMNCMFAMGTTIATMAQKNFRRPVPVSFNCA